MAGLLVGGALTACEPRERAETGFMREEAAPPVPVLVLRSDSSRTAAGHRVAVLDVLLPPGAGEVAARASLQRVIDSVAVADTLATAIRVTGFVMGPLDSATQTADVLPALRATWAPVDSAGFTGARRASRYRTNYLLLRPLEAGGDAGRTP